MKLTASEKQILRFLIFPETFEDLMEESGAPYGALRDDLINLISHRYVEVYTHDKKVPVSPFYDSDNLEQFAFKATKTGLKTIQLHAV